MMPDIKQFNLLSNNEYWEILQLANQKYLSIGQQYLKLLRLCESRRVSFKDIRSHLMNEAKRCGLYSKTYVDVNGNTGYPPKKWLKEQKPAWYHQMTLFMQWVDRNYTSYDKRKVQAAPKKKKEAKKADKNVSVSKRKDAEGNEVVTTTVTQGGEITSPVTEELSNEQVLAIITSNWEVLRKLAEEKDALAEFTALMSKLGI